MYVGIAYVLVKVVFIAFQNTVGMVRMVGTLYFGQSMFFASTNDLNILYIVKYAYNVSLTILLYGGIHKPGRQDFVNF